MWPLIATLKCKKKPIWDAAYVRSKQTLKASLFVHVPANAVDKINI